MYAGISPAGWKRGCIYQISISEAVSSQPASQPASDRGAVPLAGRAAAGSVVVVRSISRELHAVNEVLNHALAGPISAARRLDDELIEFKNGQQDGEYNQHNQRGHDQDDHGFEQSQKDRQN